MDASVEAFYALKMDGGMGVCMDFESLFVHY